MVTDFLGGLDEELMRNNFVLVYELIDEMIDFGIVQRTDPEMLRSMVNSKAEESYGSTVDYIWKQWMQDKLKFSDSMTEGQSVQSIQKSSNDIFVEVREKVSAIFNLSGFAVYFKVSGMIIVKNYLINRTNLRLLFNDEF